MDTIMDLSFIIPCHNLEKYINPLLISFHNLDLTNLNVEFIFVLDGCIDHTKDIIEFNMSDYNYKLVECEVRSVGFARNEGMKVATGEFIWFVDGDDYLLDPTVLQQVLPVLRSTGRRAAKLPWDSNSYKFKIDAMVWQYIFRRDAIQNIEFSSKMPAEDNEWMRIVHRSIPPKEFYMYDKPSYYYIYRRPGSVTTQLYQTGKITY